MRIIKTAKLTSLLIAMLVIFAMAEIYRERNLAATNANTPQDVNSLDRRISMIEQRFYLLDSRISRLEQQVGVLQRTPLPTSGGGRELELVQTQMQQYERRIAEIDCALVKLDERTLTPAAREARRSGGSNLADPCRLNPGAPLRLSTRP